MLETIKRKRIFRELLSEKIRSNRRNIKRKKKLEESRVNKEAEK